MTEVTIVLVFLLAVVASGFVSRLLRSLFRLHRNRRGVRSFARKRSIPTKEGRSRRRRPSI